MIHLFPRDKKLIDLLARYEVMSSRQVRKFVFNGVVATNFFRRLRQLEKAKFIRRIGPMLDHSYAWVLGENGKDHAGLGGVELFKNRLTLEHDVTLTEIRMVLDAIGVGKNLVPECRLRREAHEQTARRYEPHKPIVVPDGLITWIYGKEAEVHALELELTFKNRKRYFELFKRYREIKKVAIIWYIVPNRVFADRMLQEWSVFNKKFPSYAATPVAFGVTEISSLLTVPMKATIRGIHNEMSLRDLYRLDHTGDHPVIEKADENNVSLTHA